MAYSTFFAPANAGFSLSSLANRLGKGISGIFDSLTRAMAINSTAHIRLAQVERLNQLTDAQLAARGLKREDIVHYVFRDLFWT